MLALYSFDERLRTAILATLAPVEVSVRALLGHELGRLDPLIHLDPQRMGPLAWNKATGAPTSTYDRWMDRYEGELSRSREEFVAHHQEKYGSSLPIWVAVELLDWGGLTNLYSIAPGSVRRSVAQHVGLSAPQMHSWMKCLNILRNYGAHHVRCFNRVYTLQPKLPAAEDNPGLAAVASNATRTFGQLSLVQWMQQELQVGNLRLLPAVMRSYPAVTTVPVSHTGAPGDWQDHPLWCH